MLKDITNTINNKFSQNDIRKRNKYSKKDRSVYTGLSINYQNDHSEKSLGEMIFKSKMDRKEDQCFVNDKSLKPTQAKKQAVSQNSQDLNNSSLVLIDNPIDLTKSFIHPFLPRSKENNEGFKLLLINKKLKTAKTNPYNSETTKKRQFILNNKHSLNLISDFTPNSTTKHYQSYVAFNDNRNKNKNSLLYMKIYKEEDIMKYDSLLKPDLILNIIDEDVTTDEENLDIAVKHTLNHLIRGIIELKKKPQSSLSRKLIKKNIK